MLGPEPRNSEGNLRNRRDPRRVDAGQCAPWRSEHATSGMDAPGGFQGKESYHTALLGPPGHDQLN